MGAFDEGGCPSQGQPGHICDPQCHPLALQGTGQVNGQTGQEPAVPIDQEQANPEAQPPKKKGLTFCHIVLIIAIYIAAAVFVSGTIYSGLSEEQELESWYQVTLCPTSEPHVYLGIGLANGQACPARDTLSRAYPDYKIAPATTYRVGGFYENVQYFPVVFRTTGSNVHLQYTVKSQRTGNDIISTREVFLTDNVTTTTTASPTPVRLLEMSDHTEVSVYDDSSDNSMDPRGDDDDDDDNDSNWNGIDNALPRRRLLKGSSSSSRARGAGTMSYRSRSGSGSRYPNRGPTRTTYGRTGRNAVAPYTVIHVYRHGRITRNSKRSQGLQGSDGDCENAHTGCEDTIVNFQSRDELDDRTFDHHALGGEDGDVLLIIRAQVHMRVLPRDTARGMTETQPELYMTFATNQTPISLRTSMVWIHVAGGVFFLLIVMRIRSKRARARQEAAQAAQQAATAAQSSVPPPLFPAGTAPQPYNPPYTQGSGGAIGGQAGPGAQGGEVAPYPVVPVAGYVPTAGTGAPTQQQAMQAYPPLQPIPVAGQPGQAAGPWPEQPPAYGHGGYGAPAPLPHPPAPGHH